MAGSTQVDRGVDQLRAILVSLGVRDVPAPGVLDDGVQVRVARPPAERVLDPIARRVERRRIARTARRRFPAHGLPDHAGDRRR